MNFNHHHLGLLAGTIVTCAAAPRVFSIYRDISKARNESYLRNALLVIGNMIWVAYGIGYDSNIAAMCSISSALNATILGAAIRANRLQPTDSLPNDSASRTEPNNKGSPIRLNVAQFFCRFGFLQRWAKSVKVLR